MSTIIQVICAVALIFGATILIGYRDEAEGVKWAARYVLLGVPFLAAYLVGTGRRILARLDELEQKIDSKTKGGAP